MTILYQDNHCIVVVKPHGQPTQPDASGDVSLLQEVAAELKRAGNKQGEAFVGLVHRLDRPVGGVMVFAKTSKGAARLSEQFRAHSVKKIYRAVVEGVPSEVEGHVTLWLTKNEKTNHVTAHKHPTPNAAKADLDYRVVSSNGRHTLVEVTPQSGRAHQIRVSMQSLGCPIVGDGKYGSKTSLSGSIALFATSLTFAKPVGGERIYVEAEPLLPAFTL